MDLAFIVGADTVPESYWRVLLPAKALRAPALGTMDAYRGERPRIAWIHEPLSEAALEIAQSVKARGGRLVADWSEDAWTRDECGEGVTMYSAATLQIGEKVNTLADVVVVANPALAEFIGGQRVEVLEPRLAALPELGETQSGVVAWWSDGRQRGGIELAGASVTRAVEEIDGRLWHIQFRHMLALRGLPVQRQHIVGGDVELEHLQRHAAMAELSVDCWPAVSYRDTVSDTGLLRMAALGVPTVTNRAKAPPGTVSAPFAEWPDIIRNLHESPESRRALSLAAREWAATRVGFDRYREILDSLEA
jgi:hypothetical protein